MELVADIRPYTFARIFDHFRKVKSRSFPQDLMNEYFAVLLRKKNFWLRKELKASTNNDQIQPEWFYDENEILASALVDLSVADTNDLWRAFGEGAREELGEERLKGFNSKMFGEYFDESALWEYRTFWSILFFNLLINEAIVKRYEGTNFQLHYYSHIVAEILRTFQKFKPENIEEVTTVYHELIEIIIRRVYYWLNNANEYVHPSLFYDILRCLGSIIDDICKSPYYGEARKLYVLDLLFRNYFGFDDNEEYPNLIAEYEKTMLKPSLVTTRATDAYYTYLATAWKDFDKVPHRAAHGDEPDYEELARLKEKVIKPLGFDPDLY